MNVRIIHPFVKPFHGSGFWVAASRRASVGRYSKTTQARAPMDRTTDTTMMVTIDLGFMSPPFVYPQFITLKQKPSPEALAKGDGLGYFLFPALEGFGQVLASVAAFYFGHFFGSTHSDHFPALVAAFGAKVNDPVCGL